MTTVQDAKAVAEDRMTLTSHLTELRTRLFRAAIAIVVVSIVAFTQYGRVQLWLLHYYRNAVSNDVQKFITLGPLDGFGVRLTLCSYIGLFGASPVWIWQGWRFIAPGLKASERKYAVPFLLSSVVLFLSGAAVALITVGCALFFPDRREENEDDDASWKTNRKTKKKEKGDGTGQVISPSSYEDHC